MNMECPKGFKLINEGKAKLCVPDPELYRRSDGVYEPAWAPVFYNPAMVENRDLSTAFLRAAYRYGKSLKVAIDAMCSTGVRGIRIAKEVENIDEVHMVDIDSYAVELSRINVRINGLEDKIRLEVADCREYLYRSKREHVRIDYIDIDPFGSPAPFVQAAIESVGTNGVVAFTATDLAPLEGKYPKKLLRRYGVIGKMCGASKHVAIRNLIAFIARIAAIVDRFVKPLYSYYFRHYVRVYVIVSKGKSRSYEMINECIGFISYCNTCGYWSMGKAPMDKCPICGTRMDVISGTWICETLDQSWAKIIKEEVERCDWYKESSIEIASKVLEEASVGNFLPYRISFIARSLKVSMPKLYRIIEELRNLGYSAARAYGYHDAIITNAPIQVLREVVKHLSPSS